jgi:hypothetical protein
MNRARLFFWLIAAASVAVIAIASYDMSQRIARANADDPKPLFVFRDAEINTSELWHGKPVVFTENLDDAGRGTVTIYYGQTDFVELRVTVPSEYDLPGMQQHADWLRVMDFADAAGMGIDEFRAGLESGTVPMRRVAVTRGLPAGVNPETYGRVKRTDWVFDFYEFLPEGGFEHQHLVFPESQRSFQRRAGQAEMRGETIERNPGELKDQTWQFNAAMQVMPAGSAPKHTFNRSALMKAGWTLPAIAVAFITLLMSIGLALAPERRTADNDEHAAAAKIG